ncbi:hypothetical protein [Paraburkholderia strydomiana]|uniref:hypothetical protein n=1 Tax=Paraburkholderia strydomiana TaxID=1245417 RepID=UPI002865FB6B|nr:hypothetical protein [Paraburkholderia strydomiana]MDR7009289.1 hypothetical protein [Paraburkholderia strydomiana]
MNPNRFWVGNIECTFRAVPIGVSWAKQIVQMNHGKSPPEVSTSDGVVLFGTEAEALSFVEGLAHDLAESHLK